MTPRKLLPLILLVAAAVRLWGLGFGLPYAGSRVDETAVAGPAVQFLSGALRPPDFMYPTGLLYAVAILYVVWFAINRPFGTYASLAAFAESRRQSLAPFFYLSRGLSAAMGTLTVWWVFAIAIPLSMAGTAVGGLILDRMSDVNFKRWTKYIVSAVGLLYLVQAAQLFLRGA